MPVRRATYTDLLPASRVFAAAFHHDHLFGDFIHPHRDKYPDDVHLYYLAIVREAYFSPENHVIVSYSVDAETGQEQQITGVAHWIRYHRDLPPVSWTSHLAQKTAELYNAVEAYFYPNRAMDAEHDAVMTRGYPFYQHVWTGTRADSWVLAMVGVAPGAAKRGYGRDLVAWGFERSRQEGVSASVVSVVGQERFYKACGFDVQVGTWSDVGGSDNPFVAAGLEASPILFCDHGKTPTGMKQYGET